MDLLQNFRNKQIVRSQISCPNKLNIWLDHCEYVIHIEFDKNSKHIYKFKKRKHEINPFFKKAIQALNRQQKVLYYLRLVQHLENLSKGIQNPPKITEVKIKPIQALCECRSFNLKFWKLKNIRLDRTRHQVMVQNEKDNKIKTYELRDYLIRRSKNKSRHSIVLQAINQRPHQKSRQVYISFQDAETVKFWYTLINEEIAVCQWLRFKDLLQGKQNKSFIKTPQDLMNTSISSIDSLSKISDDGSYQSEIHEDQLLKEEEKLEKQQQDIFGKTFIDQLVDDDCPDFQEFVDAIESENLKVVQSKKNIDFFHKLLPDYELQDIMELADYQTQLLEEGKIHILKNLTNPHRFKLILNFSAKLFSPKQIFCMISQPRFIHQINTNIEEQSVKTFLKSENSAILYQTLKAFNKFYRLRDLIFVRHAFTHKNNLYMVDKSLDNINFPPFMTLVRGEISAVWGVIREEKSGELKLVGDFVIVNSGLLNDQQEASLSLKYLTGFKELLRQEPESGIESSMFDIDWNIDTKEENKKFEDIRIIRKTIQMQKIKVAKNQQFTSEKLNQIIFVKKTSSAYDAQSSSRQIYKKEGQNVQKASNQISFNSNIIVSNRGNDKIVAERQTKLTILQDIKIPQKDFQSDKVQETKLQENKANKIIDNQLEIVRKLDNNGHVIIDKGYIKKKFVTKPIQKQPYVQYSIVKGHAIWKGDWTHDEKNGGIIFINQKKMDDQKGVLKFILTKIGKNILSGKSVLNISLPVDIFSTQSNIQRLLLSMAYGPKLLQNLNQKQILQKLAQVVAFGVSNSVLYLTIQKPFNPILGETFQCWINGCPGYGQQISHHPPITALMFMGRGYRVTCQLQSKVQLHMNSGCGTNEGVYKVLFDDGTQICFITPGGQISGLTFGQRRFNLVGKSYYWIQKEKIFLQLNFEAGKKSFFSKQEKPCDLFEGKIYQVTSEFIKAFPKSKKKQPNEKDKIKVLGTFEGIWNKYIKFNSQQIFNFDKIIPLKIEYEAQPLPSDANWREDIEYRRINKITRAQAEKERLEVIQRTDRKSREKYEKK